VDLASVLSFEARRTKVVLLERDAKEKRREEKGEEEK